MSSSRALQLLADYIATPSVNPMGRSDIDASITGETRYAERVLHDLGKLAVDATLVGAGSRKSVLGYVTARDPIDTLIVASHLDTVPIDGMRIPAFDPAVAHGRMYGRGSCDTKAGLAALLAALERVLAAGTLRRDVIVVGEADEEMGSQGVRDVLAGLSGRHADWALVTEPTALELVTRHKGRLTLEVSAQGTACHASDPDAGHNAIVAIARATLALNDLHQRLRHARDASLGSGTLAVTVAAGGQAPNIVPDRAHVIVDRRMLPSETVAGVRAEIDAALREAGVADRVRIETCSLDKEPLETRDDAACVRHCQAALAGCALPTATTVAAFGTDAGPFASAGLPSVVLGPGSIEQAHTADEWVAIAQVDAMVDVLEALLTADPRADHLTPNS